MRVQIAFIPTDLRDRPQWVCWRATERGGRTTKVPHQVGGKLARVSDPRDWNLFGVAVAAYERGTFDGIGYVFSADDPLFGVDLDNCRDPDTGEITPDALEWVERFATYTEVSPSGRGLKLVGIGALPDGQGHRSAAHGVECYDRDRYFTITGARYGTFGIAPAQAALDRFLGTFFPPAPPRPQNRPTEAARGIGDADLIARAEAAKNGHKFRALMGGSTAGHAGPSEADAALAAILTFWSDDPVQIERIMRSSGLNREKWDEARGGGTYLSRTILKELSRAGATYTPPGQEWHRAAQEAVEDFGADRERPMLVVNARQDREVAADAIAAIVAANDPPMFFSRAGAVVLLARPSGSARAMPVPKELLAHALRRAADIVSQRTDRRGQVVLSPARLPEWVAVDLLAGGELAAALPPLRSIVGCPMVTTVGDLLTTPGYDAPSQTYLDAPHVKAPRSDQAAARSAAVAIMAPFGQFPFQTSEEGEEEGDRANALALMITPFLRQYIGAPAPLAVVEAPTPGTGKTLLARSLLSVSTPGLRMMSVDTRERGAEEEMGKALVATLSGAPAAVVLDNLRGSVGSSILESLLTTPDGIVEARLLGSSTNVVLDASVLTMAATGNNAMFGRDMARRCYFIRLDAGVEAPDARGGFEIADLEGHVRAHRCEMLRGVLCILSAWIDAGRPEGSGRKGSFERWASILSGVLEFVGFDGFLSSDAHRADAADPETLAWRGFVSVWAERFAGAPCHARDLVGLAVDAEIVADSPGASRSLGRKLQSARGRVFGQWRIMSTSGGGGTQVFSLRNV